MSCQTRGPFERVSVAISWAFLITAIALSIVGLVIFGLLAGPLSYDRWFMWWGLLVGAIYGLAWLAWFLKKLF
jgi:uncharacterized membrane protein YagU involved in acid resistance